MKRKFFRNASGSIEITDKKEINKFSDNPENSFLVSFPRTGSHWLRMLMELYFERPSLTRVFYYFDQDDYLTLHTHDLNLDVEWSHVIYLFRNPVETIYSQLHYHNEDIDNQERISYWSKIYAEHLDKWLIKENFTTKKTIIKYEYLKADPHSEFRKLCNHFNVPFNPGHFDLIASQISKESVKDKTHHDPQVIDLNQTYAENRLAFKSKHQNYILGTMLKGREQLLEDLEGLDEQ